ncbi:hypothetical protein NNL21_01260 [Paenibacillus mendelii]|nr:hypothetical protein [Paenibacillus mendelii]
MEGDALCRFRYDVPEGIIEQLEELCADELTIKDLQSRAVSIAFALHLWHMKQGLKPWTYFVDGDMPL